MQTKRIIERIFRKERHDVALVLSSGGARGLAHVGAIDSLLAHGYNITSIAGCSFGAIGGGMYASGHFDDFKAWMADIDRRRIRQLTDYKISLNSIIKGEKVVEAMQKFCPDRDIETLPIPFCCVATDWKTGREVVFRKGSLWEAIRASISVPGYFHPLEKDDKILIDGGITNPFPLDHVSRSDHDILVGVNVSGHDYIRRWERKEAARVHQIRNSKALSFLTRLLDVGITPALNYYTLLDQAISISIAQNAHRAIQITPPDILVDIPMKRFGGGDYDKYAQIREVGQKKTDKAIEKFLS
jgi:NTE family protein